MYRGEKGTEVFNILEKMTMNDIIFVENNDVYFKGDYGYIIEICGRKDIAKWRRGQFSDPDGADIYIYACMDDTRYISNGCIEKANDPYSVKRHLFNLLKYKLRHAEEDFKKLQLKIQKNKENSNAKSNS